MAQFVTHIQPTLMEASHHHPPHYYQHHKDHHKECHIKDCLHTDCRHKPHEHHKEGHHKDAHHKECTVKDCHSKECHKEHHKDTSHKECSKEYQKDKKNGEKKSSEMKSSEMKSPPLSDDSLKEYNQSRKGSHSYKDSHGIKHEYELHFVDQQGIYRESEVPSHFEDNKDEKSYESHPQSLHSRSEHEIKPIPPQFIDIQPVHSENKGVSLFFKLFFLGSC